MFTISKEGPMRCILAGACAALIGLFALQPTSAAAATVTRGSMMDPVPPWTTCQYAGCMGGDVYCKSYIENGTVYTCWKS